MDRDRESKQNKSEPKITRGGGGMIVGVSNPRQEKRGQKGLEAAYNSGLMVGWTKGVDGEEQGLDGRITRSLPVAPARASVSVRPALSPLVLAFPFPPPYMPPSFVTPFSSLFLHPIPSPIFSPHSPSTCSSTSSTKKNPTLSFFSLCIRGVTKLPRMADASKLSHNGVTCPLLSRALVIPYRLRSSPLLNHSLRHLVLLYTSSSADQMNEGERERHREREREMADLGPSELSII